MLSLREEDSLAVEKVHEFITDVWMYGAATTSLVTVRDEGGEQELLVWPRGQWPKAYVRIEPRLRLRT